MKISNQKTFHQRKFVSVGLFLTLIVLVITAIVIQIFEAVEIDFYIHLFTVIHIFNGFAFTILSISHIIKNWRPMKNYIKTKKLVIDREVIYALLLTISTILVGFLFVYFLID